MIRNENDCVGCPQGCINCGRKSVPHWYCDRCEAEVDEWELWKYEGEELCEECLKEAVPKVDYTDHENDDYDDAFDRADYEYDRWRDMEEEKYADGD